MGLTSHLPQVGEKGSGLTNGCHITLLMKVHIETKGTFILYYLGSVNIGNLYFLNSGPLEDLSVLHFCSSKPTM